MLKSDDVGKLILRLTLGGLMLFHGIHKLQHVGPTVHWMQTALAAHHVPGFVAYGVFIGEVLAPVIIILGLYTRIGGLLIVINMIFAILLVHTGEFLTLTHSGGWALQLDAFFLLNGLVLICLGGGRYAMNRH